MSQQCHAVAGKTNIVMHKQKGSLLRLVKYSYTLFNTGKVVAGPCAVVRVQHRSETL